MATYRIKDFMMSDEILCALCNYPIEEYRQYLIRFADLTFEFEGRVKALMVDLTIPSINRVSNVSLSGYTVEEYDSFPIGNKPSSLGRVFWN